MKAGANDPKVYGFYTADEPSNGNIAALDQIDNYITSNAPTKMSFFVAENNGTPTNTSYAVTPANTGADLIGLDPYPVRPPSEGSEFSTGIDLNVINAAVTEAESIGWAQSQIVPVYQAFGGGGYSSYTLPTATQEAEILAQWAPLTPAPAFDFAYSWGVQENDSVISNTPYLEPFFAAHNA